MPSIGTRGSISARGLGFTGGSVLTVYSFPSGTTTFTVPSGVTSLESVVGRGQNGTAAYWSSNDYACVAWVNTYPTVNFNGTQSQTWSALYTKIVNFRSQINASGSGQRTISIPRYTFNMGNDAAASNLGFTNEYSTTYTVRNTANFAYYNNPPSSGQILYSQFSTYQSRGYYMIGLEFLTPATNGSDTTGFGLTFAGGVGGAATTQTYNSVSVTPGQTYTIVNSGSLTISYYVS